MGVQPSTAHREQQFPQTPAPLPPRAARGRAAAPRCRASPWGRPGLPPTRHRCCCPRKGLNGSSGAGWPRLPPRRMLEVSGGSPIPTVAVDEEACPRCVRPGDEAGAPAAGTRSHLPPARAAHRCGNTQGLPLPSPSPCCREAASAWGAVTALTPPGPAHPAQGRAAATPRQTEGDDVRPARPARPGVRVSRRHRGRAGDGVGTAARAAPASAAPPCPGTRCPIQVGPGWRRRIDTKVGEVYSRFA